MATDVTELPEAAPAPEYAGIKGGSIIVSYGAFFVLSDN